MKAAASVRCYELNSRLYLGFLSFPRGGLFLFQDPIQDTTCFIVIAPWTPLGCDNSLVSPCFSWPWRFWKVSARYFVECPSIQVCLMFFSCLGWGYGFWGSVWGEMPFLSHHITSHYITSHYIISYHIIPYHIIPYHLSYPILSHHITPYHIISYIIPYILSCPVTSHHVTSHHTYHYMAYILSTWLRFFLLL